MQCGACGERAGVLSQEVDTHPAGTQTRLGRPARARPAAAPVVHRVEVLGGEPISCFRVYPRAGLARLLDGRVSSEVQVGAGSRHGWSRWGNMRHHPRHDAGDVALDQAPAGVEPQPGHVERKGIGATASRIAPSFRQPRGAPNVGQVVDRGHGTQREKGRIAKRAMQRLGCLSWNHPRAKPDARASACKAPIRRPEDPRRASGRPGTTVPRLVRWCRAGSRRRQHATPERSQRAAVSCGIAESVEGKR